MRYRSFSFRDTRAFGAKLAREVLSRGPRNAATVVALQGELGSGKTTLIQGFFGGLKIRERPQSPTFIIVRRTPLRRGAFKNVFHVDAYRVGTARDLLRIGWGEMVRDPRHIVVVEWADRVRRAIPRGALRLVLHHGAAAHERIIERK